MFKYIFLNYFSISQTMLVNYISLQIRGLSQSPFLDIGAVSAHFQSLRTIPMAFDSLNKIFKGSANSVTHSLSTYGDILSGP